MAIIETKVGRFYRQGRRVFKEGDEKRHDNGTRSMSLNIPVCDVWEELTDPEGAADMIVSALNDFHDRQRASLNTDSQP